MPLSEHEQKLLEQMEQALYADDPKFATNIRTAGGSASRGRAALGVLAVLAGLGLLVAGVAVTPALGVVGFTIMLIGAVITYSAFTTRAVISESPEGEAETLIQKMPKAPKSSGFMDRMEDRWRKRTDGEQ
jgi:membrane-bound ClpP family serine protease